MNFDHTTQNHSATLYVNVSKLDSSVQDYLKGFSVSVKPYESVFEDLSNWKAGKIVMKESELNSRLVSKVKEEFRHVITEINPIERL